MFDYAHSSLSGVQANTHCGLVGGSTNADYTKNLGNSHENEETACNIFQKTSHREGLRKHTVAV